MSISFSLFSTLSHSLTFSFTHTYTLARACTHKHCMCWVLLKQPANGRAGRRVWQRYHGDVWLFSSRHSSQVNNIGPNWSDWSLFPHFLALCHQLFPGHCPCRCPFSLSLSYLSLYLSIHHNSLSLPLSLCPPSHSPKLNNQNSSDKDHQRGLTPSQSPPQYSSLSSTHHRARPDIIKSPIHTNLMLN